MGAEDTPVILPFGPLARKKRVTNINKPDTYRVFGKEYDQYRPPVGTQYNGDYHHANICQGEQAVKDEYRHHQPHPAKCTFLRHDVRLLNANICKVYTESERQQEGAWFGMSAQQPRPTPQYALDSTQRADYMNPRERRQGVETTGRYAANPNKEPARGGVPVTQLRREDGVNRVLREKISWEHAYDARKPGNYPVRGRRQGGFVWDVLHPSESQRVIQHHNIPVKELNEQADKFWASRQRSAPLPPIEAQDKPEASSKPMSAYPAAGLPSSALPPT